MIVKSVIVTMIALPLIWWNKISWITSGYWWPWINNSCSFFRWNIKKCCCSWWFWVYSYNVIVSMKMIWWSWMIARLLISRDLVSGASSNRWPFFLHFNESCCWWFWISSNNIIMWMEMVWSLENTKSTCVITILLISWHGITITSCDRWPLISKLNKSSRCSWWLWVSSYNIVMSIEVIRRSWLIAWLLISRDLVCDAPGNRRPWF